MTPSYQVFDNVRSIELGGETVEALAVAAEAWDAEVIVGVALHNQAGAIAECLTSVWRQEAVGFRVGVVILDDASTDDWPKAAGSLLSHPSLIVIKAACGSAARSRNLILDFVDTAMNSARWVARLDADDRFSSPTSLSAACAAATSIGARFVLGGNRLRHDGCLLRRENPATISLLDPPYVLSRLRTMADGTADNELPSCNLMVARQAGYRYPLSTSAEDHWMVADMLLNHASEGAIMSTPFYCDYTLDGNVTCENRRTPAYLHSRQLLYEAAERWATTQCRTT